MVGGAGGGLCGVCTPAAALGVQRSLRPVGARDQLGR